ncbi:PTS sugar transporter subunit IIA [Vibrio sp. 404]|uniref:PTS sugar transporter subunit IIA n=1 Tax=Vibrio marinisediminis TaxID=2758441 RepID=A0A7W2IU32_9VIBR|nr:fructose PTS transporter subunit IIA [Vibrio marinisediminis]MBA5763206.1 PTS sugar transporter subunit IIA [Vibrio marinisediminis]
MKLVDLIYKDAISIGGSFGASTEAIEALTDKLCLLGKIEHRGQFVAAVIEREEQGPTALGEGLAVPHGKSDSVIEPCVAIAILDSPVKWVGIDEDEEDVDIIVLLGIPLAHQGDTHIALLSELTCLLIDDEFRDSIKRVNSAEALIELIRTASE